MQQDPNVFAHDVLRNELESQRNDHSLWSFHERKVEDGKEKLFAVCQTRHGEIDRLIAINGQTLDPRQAQAENRRIQNLVAHPDELHQKQKKQREDGDRAEKLLTAFPDAFRFQYDGTQGDLVRLKFTPNPKFHPSDRAEQVFHHMEGSLLLDAKQKRLAAIDGHLTSEVKFGGGLFGHLNQGGTFTVRQQEVDSGSWVITEMRVQMSGKALFFKTISVQENQTYTDFKPVPAETTLERAAELVEHDGEQSAASLN